MKKITEFLKELPKEVYKKAIYNMKLQFQKDILVSSIQEALFAAFSWTDPNNKGDTSYWFSIYLSYK